MIILAKFPASKGKELITMIDDLVPAPMKQPRKKPDIILQHSIKMIQSRSL